MADFEPPSFSLGLDFGFDFEPGPNPTEDPPSIQAPQCSATSTLCTIAENEIDDDDFASPTVGTDPQVSDPPRTLNRLRRGLTGEPSSAFEKKKRLCNDDDEIEEFSSQEELPRDQLSSTQYHSGCSSSKLSLRGHVVLTTQSACQLNATMNKSVPRTVSSADAETSSSKLTFPKFTVSPLRRFLLVDSDSEDFLISENANREAGDINLPLKERQPNFSGPATSSGPTTKPSESASPIEDLWDDFSSRKNFHIPTPALDEVCEEYFRSVKNKNGAENKEKSGGASNNVINQHWDSSDPLPPAHRYFFHNDPRIQKLVRIRLPNFFPLAGVSNRCEQSIASGIDYMGQFNSGESSKQGVTEKAQTSSRRGRKISKKLKAEGTIDGIGSWVNPKRCAEIPKDAGKRRVQAVGRSTGHWYTAPGGRTVYVSKNGQELSGQIAYRHYRKESGAGFKRSKKRKAAKKK